MNVLIIPSFFYNKSNPSSGSFFFEQAEALRRKGHSVYILFCDTYSAKDFRRWLGYAEKNEIKKDVFVYRKRAFCPLKHGSGFYGCHERFAKEIVALYREYLADKRIDVIHAHCCAWAGYAAMKLSEQTGIPYVITEHSTMYALQKERICGKYEQAIRHGFLHAKKTICVSTALTKTISPYASQAMVLGNVIDCELYSPEPSKNNNDKITFLSVFHMGSTAVFSKKGVDLLINAFAMVIKDHPNAHLKIGGGGKAKQVLEQELKERGLLDNVTLLGPLSRQEVAEQMRQCDIFVLPSRYETFGVVYAEAMACGKPVIATKTGGPDSFVTEDTGILIDVENQEQLMDAMGYMIENHGRYDSNIIRSHIEGLFSMEAVANQLEEIYREII